MQQSTNGRNSVSPHNLDSRVNNHFSGSPPRMLQFVPFDPSCQALTSSNPLCRPLVM